MKFGAVEIAGCLYKRAQIILSSAIIGGNYGGISPYFKGSVVSARVILDTP